MGDDLGKGKFGKVKIGYPKKKDRNTNLNTDDIISKNEEEKFNEQKEKEKEKIAIKIINKTNFKNFEMELVKCEIEIMKFCRFKNIVRIQENFEDHENIYIILEYLSGGNLNHYLGSQKCLLSEKKIKETVLQLANGIKYLHFFGIIHRDLKPENIMMSDKSDSPILKIVDFGLSKVLGITEKSNESYGTLAFAAPELILKKNYNKSIDIWSLGVIVYFLLCGNYPFNDKDNDMRKIALEITKGEIKFSGNVWKRISSNASNLVRQCLERDVLKRIDINGFFEHDWFKE
jgi:serine/threonine protein kinase